MPASRPSGVCLGASSMWGVTTMYDQIMGWMIIIGIAAYFTPVMWFAHFFAFGMRAQQRKAFDKADWRANGQGLSHRKYRHCQREQARLARLAARPVKPERLPDYRNGEPVRRGRRHIVKY